MPARKSFQVGEKVLLQGKVAHIERVERPSDRKLHPKTDMGRYTLRYDDGSRHYNAPGYLMARPGQDRR